MQMEKKYFQGEEIPKEISNGLLFYSIKIMWTVFYPLAHEKFWILKSSL